MSPMWRRQLERWLSRARTAGRPTTALRPVLTCRPRVERLEDRTAPAVFTVVNTAAGGAGSLADAISQANALLGADQIHFNIPAAGVQTINLTGPLPTVTDPVVIDGYTQPGASPNTLPVGGNAVLLIELRQTGGAPATDCLTVAASNSTVRGLVINGFTNSAVTLTGDDNLVAGNFIGTNTTGTAQIANLIGVRIMGGAAGNTVGGTTAAARNLIGGNAGTGVLVFDVGADGNVIQGNYIGTDVTGTLDLGNGAEGVSVNQGPSGNLIGGTAAGAGNLISGNAGSGVALAGVGTTGNTVLGNFIGTDAAGTAKVGNGVGVNLTSGAAGNLIGGPGSTSRNVVSGNAAYGILLNTPGGSGNRVQGNYVGTDASGLADLGNGFVGVAIANGSGGNLVGTDGDGVADADEGNVISGNDDRGVAVAGSNNVIAGNIIGLGSDGATALGNASVGIQFLSGSAGNRVGTDGNGVGDAFERNVISSNALYGIQLGADGTSNNLIAGNFIGTDATGIQARGNLNSGVIIHSGAANNNTVGGLLAVMANVISGNVGAGISISGGPRGNVVLGNYIGTNVTGTAAIPNLGGGVGVASPNNTIGGTAPGARNVISGNAGSGVHLSGAGTTGNTVAGNYIGLGADGDTALPNGFGVRVENVGAGTNTIGGTAAGSRNVISGNTNVGVLVLASSNTLVAGNYIGTDATGTLARGNVSGVVDQNNSFHNLGGPTAAHRNVISGNTETQVVIGNGGLGGTIQGNYIGLNAAGTGLIAGGTTGIGTAIGARDGVQIVGNAIAGYDAGIRLLAGAAGFSIRGNTIGLNAAGTAVMGGKTGIVVHGPNTVIGGPTTADRNVIATTGVGIQVTTATAKNTVIAGNWVGVYDTGNESAGGTTGVEVSGGATDTLIGGFTALPGTGAGNVISGHTGSGVSVQGGGTDRTVVRGNLIGLGADGATDLGNGQSGVDVSGAGAGPFDTLLGGDDAADGTADGQVLARNVISGNAVSGVSLSTSGSNVRTKIQGNFIGTNRAGTAAVPNGYGVSVGNAPGTLVGGLTAGAGNVISGNAQAGVIISVGLGNTAVQGNRIGTNAAGTAAIPNVAAGVRVETANNLIGGTAPGARNIISGNTGAGVLLTGAGATGNVVAGNYIGTDASGALAVPNATTFPPGGVLGAVHLESGATNNTVGGTAAGAGNVISGNAVQGIQLVGVTDNVIQGNIIGLDVTGAVGLGNAFNGVSIVSGGSNTVGGAAPGARNVIAANGHSGMYVTSTASNIEGNYIGTNVTGTLDRGNTFNGISFSSASGNTVRGNLISGNDVSGVQIFGLTGADATGNLVVGNRIGTDASGTLPLGNQWDGVLVQDAAGNTIGGLTAADRNLISGNKSNGIVIFGAAATANVIRGNFVGTDVTGALGLGNFNGVVINAAANNTVGGTAPGTGNLISGNTAAGVLILGAGANGNTVAGNSIGTNAAGAGPLGNGGDGVGIEAGAAGNTIGGTTAGARNLISGNTGIGINLQGVGTTGNLIQGNYVGVDVTGTAALGNFFAGIFVGAPGNTIGGDTAAARNLISGNAGYGVVVSGAQSSGNVIRGNYIGTNAAGTGPLGNTGYGASLQDGANNTLRGNVISANGESGVLISGPATGSLVVGNLIGTNAAGTAALGNAEHGVYVQFTSGVVVGSAAIADRNVISANAGSGVYLLGGGGGKVQGNYIGTDAAGLAPLGNLQTGITIDGATGTLVGTDGNGVGDSAERNVIAATDLTGGGPTFGHGVLVTGAGASGNAVAGNFIGTDATGANPLGNAGSGVMVYNGPTGTTVGGATAARANVIAFNLRAGVTVEAGADPVSGTTIRFNSIFANYGLGIDLGGDHAVTINDFGDSDSGANGLLNFPVVNGATAVGNALVVTGFAPNGTTVDLYATDTTPDASGFGQGRTYLGTIVVASALTGTYGPKPLLGALLGTDTTNRFTAIVPFPSGFSTLSRVTATAWDGSSSSEFGNNAPVLIGALSVGVSPPTIPEGGEVTLAGSFPIADPSHTHTLLINWGDGSSETHAIRAGVAAFAVPHRYLDDNAADSFPIDVTVIDDVTGFAQSSTATAAVTNEAPTVRIVSSGTNADGSQVTLTAQVADPGVNDTFTYTWTIVSNGTATTFSGKSFTFTRSLATSSVISVTVTDDDGGSDSDTTAVRALTPGNDTLDGASALTDADVPAGADRLVVLALAGNDFINASAMTRPVEIVGDDGHDTLTGGSGADILDDGHGDDLLRGNGGDDVYRLTPGSDDVISELTGGTTGFDTGGRDRVDFSRAESGIAFSLDEPGVAQVVSAGNTVTAYGVFEDLAGSAFADDLTGNDLDNEVYGGLGADTIAAGDGDDVIFGGTPPNDTVTTADGDDVIYGGLGADTISAGDGDDVIFGGVAPDDTVSAADGDDVIFGGIGDDTISAGDGDDVIFGGPAPGDTVGAGADDDVIYGGGGLDTISAGDGDDVIFGGPAPDDTVGASDGDDVIYGGLGNDTISADAGDDVVYGGPPPGDTVSAGTDDDVIYGGVGNDTISASEGDDVVYGGPPPDDTISAGTDNDVIYGGVGNDTISASEGDDVIFGGVAPDDTTSAADGDDVIYGGAGNDTITADAGDDVVYGGVPPGDTVGSASDDDVIYGGVGNDTISTDSGDDVIYGDGGVDLLEVIDNADLTATGDAISGQVVGGGRVTLFQQVERVALRGGLGNNLLDATGLGLPAILTGGGGNDTLLGGSQADELEGGAGNDSLAGGASGDLYLFAGGTLGSDTVNEPPGGGADALDFRRFAGPVVLSLALTGPQVVHPAHLTLALTAGNGVEDVFGSTYSDTLTGNALANNLVGGGGRDVIAGDAGGDTLQGNVTQVVFLDFDTETGAGDHVYTPAERQAIRDRIAADFALFNFDFTLARPAGGAYVTLFFNQQPLAEKPEVFGLAEELDWRNQRLGGSAAIDVNFLARVPATDNPESFIAVTATIGAHELGHLLGLRHWDAFALIGQGIFAGTAADRWLPAYAGPQAAAETPFDLMASPRSVGVSELDALGDPHLGQRSAVKLAFADTGTVAFEQPGAHQTPATAQPLTLAGLAVPNTLPGRVGTFEVSALAVVGRIDLAGSGQSESDYYSFFGSAGTLMNFEIMSESLAGNVEIIDSILRIYAPGGALIYENDDGFEPTDSIILDLILPATGVYTIEVDTYAHPDGPDTDVGQYELFLYSFAAGANVGQGDRLEGGAGDDVLVGSSGADIYVFAGTNLGSDTVVAIKDNGEGVLDFSGLLGGGATVDLAATGKQLVNPNLNLTLQNTGGIRTVIGTPLDDTFSGDGLDNAFLGGDGTDRVVQAGGSFTLTANTLTGAGTDLLDGIEVVELTGGPGADALAVDGWTGLARLDGAGGGDDYVVTFNGFGGQVIVHDGGTAGPDRLFVNATAGPDLVVIHQWSVGRGPELVQFDSTFELVTVDGLTGANTAQFVEPAPTVPMVLLNFGAPTVALSGAAAVNEGAVYTLNLGAIANVVPSAVTGYTINWGDGTVQSFPGSPVGASRTHTYADGTNAARTISVSLTIAGVPVAAGSKAVVVNNVAPTVGAITAPLDPQTVNTAITASATFSDPAGLLDGPYTATWNWGDGSSETVPVPAGVFSLSRGHTYTAAGVYTITLSVTDKDGGPGRSVFQYVVVYSPAARSVTGGGWIDSPAGAIPANPGLTGMGIFGFNARYQQGGNVLTGSAHFFFHPADLHFQSTGYDWLTITGNRARLQGTGTNKGVGNFGFYISAIDGDLPGGDGVDRFRIRIWDKNNGNAVVYDSQPGAPDDAAPVSPVNGGNIKIQSGPNGLVLQPGVGAGEVPRPLAAEQLAPLVREAISRWAAAGVDPAEIAALERAGVFVVDLPAGYLGLAADGAILLDLDAAGVGWFVDPTPWEDSEFRLPGDQGEQGRVDLLSVILHEFGHILGHGHEEEGVMEETLSPGERLSPEHDHEPEDATAAVITPDQVDVRADVIVPGASVVAPVLGPPVPSATSADFVSIAPLGSDRSDVGGWALPLTDAPRRKWVAPASDELAGRAEPIRAEARPTDGNRPRSVVDGWLPPDDGLLPWDGVWVG